LRNTVIENIAQKQGQMEFSLSINAELENLPRIREFIHEAARQGCLEEQFTDDLVLAVDEIVTNVILHGYNGSRGKVVILARIAPPEVEIIVRDRATPFDPTGVAQPELCLPLEDRPIGGLGVYMARSLTDDMSYRRMEGGGNELRLCKRCPPQ
jgi:serine/threonine-protein kinase RsbW